MKLRILFFTLLLSVFATNAQTLKKDIVRLDLRTQLEYCKVHTLNTLALIPNDGESLPGSITAKSKDWNYVDYKERTSGFWPGQLWLVYETSHDKKILAPAEKYTQYLLPLTNSKATVNIGSQVFSSFGNAYELTGKKEYKQVVLRAADSLATLLNPKVGSIQSTDALANNNMISLELLFWAAKHGGSKKHYEIAVKYAETVMQNHFGTDTKEHARAIYGFTMVYRETGDRKFLDFAHKITRVYLDKLPADQIPYRDFDITDTQAPRDVPAAAITASALLELATFTKNSKLKREYEEKAMKMITELTNKYQSRYQNNALLLLQPAGNKPVDGEMYSSLIQADYYYMECLARLEKLMWVKRFF